MRLPRLLGSLALSTVLSAQAPSLQRGDTVRLPDRIQKEAGGIRDAVVVAVAGDHVYASKGVMRVNNETPPNVPSSALDRLSEQVWEQTVPEGHLVVIGWLEETTAKGRHLGTYWAMTGTEGMRPAR